MQILAFNFLLYAACGLWQPVEWSSIISTLLYNLYTVLMVCLISFLLLTQFLDLVLIVDNVEDFTTNFMVFVSCISLIFKIATALTRRNRIYDLIDILQRPPCRVCNQEEMNIQAKFDCSIRSRSLSYFYLGMTSGVAGVVGGMIIQGHLPMRWWVPYDCSSPLVYWFTIVKLAIGLFFGTVINISTETLVYGLCLQTCAQLEILIHRLQKVTNSSKKVGSRGSSTNNTSSNKASRLSEHVCHHLCIIRYAEMVNDVYSQVFFIQFFASVLVICTSMYFLSSRMRYEDAATMFVYTACMFVQILVYCWAGDEVIVKSTSLSDAIYQIDWILMTISEQKDLLMIMKRSIRPIRFTSSFLVTLSLSSYGNLLKASYSAFNVLQQS